MGLINDAAVYKTENTEQTLNNESLNNNLSNR